MEYPTLSMESKMGKQQKTYMREFKMEGVPLVKGRGKSMSQVVRDLEICDSAVSWSKQLIDQGEQAFPGSGLYCSPKNLTGGFFNKPSGNPGCPRLLRALLGGWFLAAFILPQLLHGFLA